MFELLNTNIRKSQLAVILLHITNHSKIHQDTIIRFPNNICIKIRFILCNTEKNTVP